MNALPMIYLYAIEFFQFENEFRFITTWEKDFGEIISPEQQQQQQQ